MGIIRPDASQRIEIEDFRQMLLSCSGIRWGKEQGDRSPPRAAAGDENDDVRGKLVCVTSAVSFLGVAIVKHLLIRGYSVRLILDNEEDVEMLREMELSGELKRSNNILEAVMAKLTDAESLSEAINGCCGLFHTAAFIDLAGISGYSKSMAEVEVKVSANIITACAMSPSIRNCVLTSSLLACIWLANSDGDLSPVIDHDSWSDESLCMDNKLWYALGKLRAEKVAWRIAEEMGLKLTTICPALITGPDYCQRNPTSTIAYLKGAQEMYASGSLATVDVNKLAETHISVFEAMDKSAFGRYICFDQVLESEDKAGKLAQETGMKISITSGNASSIFGIRFELSNLKLSRLMSRTLRCNN